MRLHHLIFCALAVLGLTGCPEDSEEMMAADGGDKPYESIQCPSDQPDFFIGVKAMGASELIEGELIDADKVPVGWHHNDWVVAFTGADGEALEDIEMTSAKTWMPAHGHGGGQVPTIMPLDDGEFDVDGLNINMNGPWQFIFQLTAKNADGETVNDTVTFYVCNSEPEPEDE
jgi:hypothetical protein